MNLSEKNKSFNWRLIFAAVGFGLLLIIGSIFVLKYAGAHAELCGKSYPLSATSLTLSGDNGNDLSALGQFSSLRTLSLNGMGLESADELMQCSTLEMLDVRGNSFTPEYIDKLSEALPQCEILWDIPFDGKLYSSNTTSLTLTTQDAGEYAMLPRFTKLTEVDASGALICPELAEAAKQMAECSFVWSVAVGDALANAEDTELLLNDMSFSDISELTAAIDCLPRLKRVELCDSGLSNKQMEQLCELYPNIRFVWKIHLGVWDMRTDVTNFSTAHTESRPLIPVSDFYQLKYCTDLVALDLGHQLFSDLTPISELTGLKALILSDCELTDISPLEGLVNLEFLELMQNELTDISPLANMKKLERVCLFLNNITDFSPLYDLPKLRRVWINKNPGVIAQTDEIASHMPEGCDLCTKSRGTGQGYGWRPINYTKLGFTYWHPLNGRSPAGAEGDNYPE